jgi:hypothetical protein
MTPKANNHAAFQAPPPPPELGLAVTFSVADAVSEAPPLFEHTKS